MSDEDFRAFYERTARPLSAYLSRIVSNQDEVDDILQEAYYRFYKAGREHESESHRRNSLFRIATNLVHDAGRRRKYRSDVQVVETPESGAVTAEDDRPSPDDTVMHKTDLTRAMAKLEPTQREMLWLAYANGSSHEEIASVLGLRATSIRTMLLRARRRLAAILAEDSQGEYGVRS